MKKFFTLMLFVLASCTPEIAVQAVPEVTLEYISAPACSLQYESLEENWGLSEDVPDNLVLDYVQATCSMESVIHEAIYSNASVLEVQNEQESYLATWEAVRHYWRSYTPMEVSDITTIQLWLGMARTSAIVPADLEVSEGELHCPSDLTVEQMEERNLDLEDCDRYIVLHSEETNLNGVILYWGGQLQQEYPTYTVFRNCDPNVTFDTAQESINCPVVWITQFDSTHEQHRGLNGYAMLNYDWVETRP